MASSEWSCNCCTFINPSSFSKCQMCESKRTESNAIDLTLSPKMQVPAVALGKNESTLTTNHIGVKKKRLRQATLSGKHTDIEDDIRDNSRKKALVHEESSTFTHTAVSSKTDKSTTKRTESASITTTAPFKTDKSETSSNKTNKSTTKHTQSALITTAAPFKTDKSETSSSMNSFYQTSLNTALWERALQVLKSTFGITSLRSLQPQAIQGALKGESQIVVMATGSGKSLCYQLPALVLPGLTIVISPLIALMVDQVKSLNSKGIEAVFLSSLDNTKTRNDVLHRITGTAPPKKRNKANREDQTDNDEDIRPDIKLLYCTPELISTPRFQSILKTIHSNKRLSLIAIDEAHCISSWGHDFRPSYRKLSWLRSTFADVPIMACTATATSRVIQDIRNVLSISKSDACLISSFNRPNISYEVRDKDSMGEMAALQDLVNVIKSEQNKARIQGYPCSGIVYVHKRNDTAFIAKAITDAGVSAAPYHAGLKDDQRQQVQEQWTQGTIQVAVATVAFGMGIDLPHVRYVIHWSLSKSIEGFYQESGRGGRDLKPAKSILYYSQHDASSLMFLCQQAAEKKTNPSSAYPEDQQVQSIEAVVEYCTTPGCRRKYLLNFFGEKIDPKSVCKKSCDFCINPEAIHSRSLGFVQQGSSNRSHQYISRAAHKNDDWDGQWDRPHNDCSSVDEDDPPVKENQSSSFIHSTSMSTFERKGPTKPTKEILTHYEAMECQSGKTNGFVNFKSKSDSRSRIMGKLKF